MQPSILQTPCQVFLSHFWVPTFVSLKLRNSLNLSSSLAPLVDKHSWRSHWGPWHLASAGADIHGEGDASQHSLTWQPSGAVVRPQSLSWTFLLRWRGGSVPIFGACFGIWPSSECCLVPSSQCLYKSASSFQCCARNFYLPHWTPPQPTLLCVPRPQCVWSEKLAPIPSSWYSLLSGLWKGRREEKREYSFPGSLSISLWFEQSSTNGSCQAAPSQHLGSSSRPLQSCKQQWLSALLRPKEIAIPFWSLIICPRFCK